MEVTGNGRRATIAIALVCLGLFGMAFTISGLLGPLPRPAVGGTCGPGKGSEAAVIAVFDPVTIGAGPEPPASQSRSHAGWLAFVHACQSASDQRAAITLPLLLASVAVLVIGSVLLWRRHRQDHGHLSQAASGGWSTGPPPVGPPPFTAAITR